MDYYVARWYDSTTGHFTSADYYITRPMIASSYDRYGYVKYNPIKFIDSNGHDAGCPASNPVCEKPSGYSGYRTDELNKYMKILDNFYQENKYTFQSTICPVGKSSGYPQTPASYYVQRPKQYLVGVNTTIGPRPQKPKGPSGRDIADLAAGISFGRDVLPVVKNGVNAFPDPGPDPFGAALALTEQYSRDKDLTLTDSQRCIRGLIYATESFILSSGAIGVGVAFGVAASGPTTPVGGVVAFISATYLTNKLGSDLFAKLNDEFIFPKIY